MAAGFVLNLSKKSAVTEQEQEQWQKNRTKYLHNRLTTECQRVTTHRPVRG
jgi:hypothetical protein